MELEQLTKQQFDRFREIIYRESGNRVDPSKVVLISNRIRRRQRAGDFADFNAYYRFLISPEGRGEMEHFLDAVTTNETSFFRTPSHFDWFRDEFIPEVSARDRDGLQTKSLRIWSAACSTGEEPYSLGICLAENRHRFRDWNLSILGTDISERVLREGREGIYKARAIEGVDASYLKKYFEEDAENETWSVRSSLRKLVEFRRHNLMEPLRMPPFDCVFIRNVLIYFDRESKLKVIENLIQSLCRGGYLVIGPSEGVYDMLEPLVKRSIFLYQKP